MFNIMSHKGNASQNHNERPGEAHQNGYNKMIIASVYEDVEKWELSFIAGGM